LSVFHIFTIMKNLLVIIALLFVTGLSCKTKPQSEIQSSDIKSGATKTTNKTQGKVSHEYRATGCKTVVVVKTVDASNPMILIPITALPDKFDKDGLNIYFNYSLSRIKNPEGCSHGIPAELTDISLK
jgi:hypothetical protein